MKLLVRLFKDMPGNKESGMPADWPAEVTEVADDVEDPKDGRLVMKDSAELEAYKLTLKDEYDVYLEGVILPQIKNIQFDSVDDKTSRMISQGFTFAGKQFSLSANAQVTYTGLFIVRDEAALVYPVRVNTLDDLDSYELKNAAEVKNFYLTAIATCRTHLDAGSNVKSAIRAVATSTELKDIKDNR